MGEIIEFKPRRIPRRERAFEELDPGKEQFILGIAQSSKYKPRSSEIQAAYNRFSDPGISHEIIIELINSTPHEEIKKNPTLFIHALRILQMGKSAADDILWSQLPRTKTGVALRQVK